jgi:branched-chain amino acid transport system substrate-binding protein
MKKLINSLILVLIIALMSIGTLTGYSSEGTIKIGFAGPTTGGGASYGMPQVFGATMAIEEVNAKGGINGKMVELVVMDDRTDPKEASTIAMRLVSDPDILAVLGHSNSSCTLAAAPIYNKGGLVNLTTTSSAPSISDAGPYTFRLFVTDAYRAKFDIEAMVEAGYDKIAIIFENNDFGRGGYNAALKTLNDLGLEPVAEEAYLLGETKDFTTTITKLKNIGAEAIYALSDEAEIALFLMQCKQLDYNPFFMSIGTYNPAVMRIGKEAVEGAVGAAISFALEPSAEFNTWWERFLDRFKAEGVEAKDMYSPVAYDAVRLILKAIEERGEDREAIKNYLDDIKSWKGIVGEVSFDENGDSFLPLVHVMIKDGEFVSWSPETHKR